MAMRKCDMPIMALLVWMLELFIITYIVQYTWNSVLVDKTTIPKKGEDGLATISWWQAFLISLSVKLMIWGSAGILPQLMGLPKMRLL